MSYTISQIMRAWREAALAEWARTVRDDQGGEPGDRDRITRYFEAVGWGWHVTGGYVERPDNPWCGIGQGYCGLRVGRFLRIAQCVGVHLAPGIARYVLPSTQRIASLRRWRQAGEEPPSHWHHGDSLEELAELLAIPRIATVATREYGDVRDDVGGHYILTDGYDAEAGTIDTIEFNGWGELGDGSWGEGVVRRRGDKARPLSSLRRVYSLGLDHFEHMER